MVKVRLEKYGIVRNYWEERVMIKISNALYATLINTIDDEITVKFKHESRVKDLRIKLELSRYVALDENGEYRLVTIERRDIPHFRSLLATVTDKMCYMILYKAYNEATTKIIADIAREALETSIDVLLTFRHYKKYKIFAHTIDSDIAELEDDIRSVNSMEKEALDNFYM